MFHSESLENLLLTFFDVIRLCHVHLLEELVAHLVAWRDVEARIHCLVLQILGRAKSSNFLLKEMNCKEVEHK